MGTLPRRRDPAHSATSARHAAGPGGARRGRLISVGARVRSLSGTSAFGGQRSFMKEQGAVMKMDTFEAITRGLGTRSPRRMALRALGGALLAGADAGAAGRLGLAEETEAKQTSGRTPRAERNPHG